MGSAGIIQAKTQQEALEEEALREAIKSTVSAFSGGARTRAAPAIAAGGVRQAPSQTEQFGKTTIGATRSLLSLIGGGGLGGAGAGAAGGGLAGSAAPGGLTQVGTGSSAGTIA